MFVWVGGSVLAVWASDWLLYTWLSGVFIPSCPSLKHSANIWQGERTSEWGFHALLLSTLWDDKIVSVLTTWFIVWDSMFAHLCCKLNSCLGDLWNLCLDGKQIPQICTQTPLAVCYAGRQGNPMLAGGKKIIGLQGMLRLGIRTLKCFETLINFIWFYCIHVCFWLRHSVPISHSRPLNSLLASSLHWVSMLFLVWVFFSRCQKVPSSSQKLLIFDFSSQLGV